MNVGIVGLGLIGGSMARAVSHAGGHNVFGADRSPAAIDAASEAGAINRLLTEETIPFCDVVLVALYPQAAVEFVRKNAKSFRKGSLVVDLCGVKGAVVPECFELAETYGFHFIGGHPMAGREVSGFAASQAELFDGASMILVPPENMDVAVICRAAEFFTSLGFGRITISTTERHDRVIAYTSQLAHVLSSAYVQSELSAMHGGFSAGSFKDLTRVARLKVDMWSELFLANRDALCSELHDLIERLQAFETAIGSGNREALESMLARGVEMKEASEHV